MVTRPLSTRELEYFFCSVLFLPAHNTHTQRGEGCPEGVARNNKDEQWATVKPTRPAGKMGRKKKKEINNRVSHIRLKVHSLVGEGGGRTVCCPLKKRRSGKENHLLR
jgi:hypothetical protein